MIDLFVFSNDKEICESYFPNRFVFNLVGPMATIVAFFRHVDTKCLPFYSRGNEFIGFNEKKKHLGFFFDFRTEKYLQTSNFFFSFNEKYILI